MNALFEIVEGWTAELGPFTLLIDGVPFPGGLAGFQVELKLRTLQGVAVTPGGTVRLDPDQRTYPGRVWYTPVVADFQAVNSPYRLHWQVTDGGGRTVSFPSGPADTVVVHP